MTKNKTINHILGAISIPFGLIAGLLIAVISGIVGFFYFPFKIAYSIFDKIVYNRYNQDKVIGVKVLENGNYLLFDGEEEKELTKQQFNEFINDLKKKGNEIYVKDITTSKGSRE